MEIFKQPQQSDTFVNFHSVLRCTMQGDFVRKVTRVAVFLVSATWYTESKFCMNVALLRICASEYAAVKYSMATRCACMPGICANTIASGEAS